MLGNQRRRYEVIESDKGISEARSVLSVGEQRSPIFTLLVTFITS